jgi:YidC/Oxa1 family membrane protein insertase
MGAAAGTAVPTRASLGSLKRMPEYRSPQNEPGMDRNLLFVFLLMVVVIFGAQLFFKKSQPSQQPASIAHPSQQPIEAGAPSTPASAASAQQPGAASTKKPTPAAQAAAKQASSESEIVVENDVYKITFSNRGAQAKSWILKKYSDDQGKPLDLVNRIAAAKYGYPLSLWTYDEGLRTKLASALYVPSSSGTLPTPGDLSFEYSDAGLSVRKTFHFDQSYVIGVDTTVFLNGSPVWAFPAWPSGFGDQTNLPAYAASQFEYQVNNNTERVALKKVSGDNTLHGTFNWLGVSDTYFAAAFIPNDPENLTVITLRSAIELAGGGNEAPKPAEVLGVAVGRPGQSTGRLFVGPKSLTVLEAIHVPTIIGSEKDLRGVVNFGSLGLIARPLFIWLRWTYNWRWVRNWGWAIVIQTILITVALLPLRLTQMKSALKMQRVQPQMKAIQEKYKKYSMRDPRKQEMQKEIAALYKEHGVNPFGGCLPLLVQLPFLWAYYRMLGAAIDLRQAHWLWIRDLSSPDPYYLLPIIMVVSMIVMQRMTPQPGIDPAQQRMMNIMMPLFMGFIFFKLAAGLNLYYALSNLIMIAQQAIMNRTTLGREMREIAAKRARKKGSS